MNKKIFNKLLSSTVTASVLLSNFQVWPLLHCGAGKEIGASDKTEPGASKEIELELPGKIELESSEEIKLGMSEENLQLTKAEARQKAIELLEQTKLLLERAKHPSNGTGKKVLVELPKEFSWRKDGVVTEDFLQSVNKCFSALTMYSPNMCAGQEYFDEVCKFVKKNLKNEKKLTIDNKRELIVNLLKYAKTQHESYKDYANDTANINELLRNTRQTTNNLLQQTINLITLELQYIKRTNSNDLSDDFLSWFDKIQVSLDNFLRRVDDATHESYWFSEYHQNINSLQKLVTEMIQTRGNLVFTMAASIQHYLEYGTLDSIKNGYVPIYQYEDTEKMDMRTPKKLIRTEPIKNTSERNIRNANLYSTLDVASIDPNDPKTFEINRDKLANMKDTLSITSERMFWDQSCSALNNIDKTLQVLRLKAEQSSNTAIQYSLLTDTKDWTAIETLFNKFRHNPLPGVNVPPDITNYNVPACFTDDLIADITTLSKKRVDTSDFDKKTSSEICKPKQASKNNGNFYIPHPHPKKSKTSKHKKVSPSKSKDKKVSPSKIKDKKTSEYPPFEDAPFDESLLFDETPPEDAPFDEDKPNLNQLICTYTTEDGQNIRFKNREEIFDFVLKYVDPILSGNNLIYRLKNCKLNNIGIKDCQFLHSQKSILLNEGSTDIYVRVHETDERYKVKPSQKYTHRIYFSDLELGFDFYLYVADNGSDHWTKDPNESLEKYKNDLLEKYKNDLLETQSKTFNMKAMDDWGSLQAHSHFCVPVESNCKITETISSLRSKK